MTSFQWKKNAKLRTATASQFCTESESEEETEVDWLCPAKRVCTSGSLEDCGAKSKRLQNEGALLAENGRYWEAIKYWDEAIQLTPHIAVLHEMKSQALLEVGEVFLAVMEGEKAVSLNPCWAVARQTLGRAQLGMGELTMARDNFQKALHLSPSDPEIRADLKWTLELLDTKKKTTNNH